jgi:tetratricopeptide repeat protein
MFGRTERLLSRGQLALSRRDYTAAETLLRAAVARTPRDPHAHLYLAHALAEQERLAEAERALAVATALAPTAFVFRLHQGIVLLDAGDLPRARAALLTASTAAPDNRLVAGYKELVAWAERGGPASARLVELAGELPESFGARVLLHLARVTLETRGPRAVLEVVETPPEPPGLPLALWVGALRYRDRVRYVEDLIRRERFDDAVYFIAAQPALLRDARAPMLLERGRRGALRAVDAALAGGGAAPRGTLLLQRYELEHDLGDDDAVRRTLSEWRDLYAASGAPRSERSVAAAVIRQLAALEVGRGLYTEALALCAASRAARHERETGGVEALALVGLGQHRAARHAFAAFLENALFRVDMRLVACAGNSPA